ncbi:SigE family RNA polymerase sigma factor [Catelliglobosispora koreensis]|uniref:SigE family RNA polymerase sigma factor n=1 Tax=Catelliglobosispora koreensis TaxID=129052 RepID=UPI00036E4BBE|nr:SigE family RNA polymerase sigma factor [Catelliglobosispora koreensis]
MTADASADFDGFYHAHFGDTVAMTYAYTADLGVAQEIAQEAFTRAWMRWRSVSTYDNPVAWVRRVATNLARSRWRQLKYASSYLLRQRPEIEPGPNPDHVAVVAALRKLPPRQRQAIVLHHLMDLPVEDVAHELEVPAGTVKSWLHRGRTALARELDIDVRNDVKTPPVSTVGDLARKYKRNRNLKAAAVLAIVLTGVAVLLNTWLPKQNPVIHPTPGPIPSPSGPTPTPTPSTTTTTTPDLRPSMQDVNYATATITITGSPTGCASGTITFRDTEFHGAEGPARSQEVIGFRPDGVVLGDLTGDGHPEAAIPVSCGPIAENVNLEKSILIVEGRADGTLHSLAWTGPSGGYSLNSWIRDNVLYVDARPRPAAGRGWDYQVGTVQALRWNGSTFVSVDVSATFPALLPTRAGANLDLNPVASQLTSCDGLPARTSLTPKFDADGLWRDGDRLWSAIPHDMDEPHYLAFTDVKPLLLLTIGCGKAGTAADKLTSTSIVLFEQVTGGWKAVGVISGPARSELRVSRATGLEITVSGGDVPGAKYRWELSRFTRVTG